MYIMVLDRNVMGFREFSFGQFYRKSMIQLQNKHIQIDSNNQAGDRKCLFSLNISPFNQFRLWWVGENILFRERIFVKYLSKKDF